MMAGFTKGEWIDNGNEIISGLRPNVGIGGFIEDGDNALAVTAVNACKQINPDNPIAVAEAINDLYQIARELYFKLPLERVSIVMKRRIAKVLTKALGERQGEADA
jgi:hypothetical protein